MRYERTRRDAGYSQATISCYMRHLRSIINHFNNVEKILPVDYQYPFGKRGFSIKNFQATKLVMSNVEIKKVVGFKKFQNKEQEYARDIWLFLYICRELKINRATFYNWKKRYSGMDAELLRRFKELERENTELKRMYADLSLDHRILKNVIEKKL